MHLSRGKFVALWQAAGMACVIAAAIGLVGVSAIVESGSWHDSLSLLRYMLAVVIVCMVAAAPLSIAMMWGWTAAVRRLPGLERSMLRTIIGLAGCAVILSLIAGGLSNWEAVVRPSRPSTFAFDTLSVARAMLWWVVVGLVLPRILVPSLRPRGVDSPVA